MRQLSILAAAVAIATGQSYIGRLDTIGGTSYDWWTSANVRRSLVNSPQYGIHAAWMYSISSGTTFPDRNVRYNYYDHSVQAWTWADADYMQGGVNVFDERAGYGVIDTDSTGLANVVAHTSSGVVLARDAAPGAGIMSYNVGPSGFQWPDLAIGDDGTCHVAMYSGVYSLAYSRVRTGSGWDSARTLSSMAFPIYAIAASKTTPGVCVTWAEDAGAYYVLSDDRGDTWGSRTELDPPPAFGGDTLARFSLAGTFPFYDSSGRLHILAAVAPQIHDTGYVNPAEIWHWCPENQPVWSEIHRAGCSPGNMQGSIGYNAIYADRPTMGEGDDGNLYVAWEQFDSSNVEPQTERLRAGVWLARSTNNGASWGTGMLLTGRNTISHRFPCIIDRVLPGDPLDTVCVLYLMDKAAGFYVQGEGPATDNPVVCQFVYPPEATSEEPRTAGRTIDLGPTIARGALMIGDRGHGTGDRADLLDVSGRKVVELHPGANDVSRLVPGVYFVREGPGTRGQGLGKTRKVVLTE
jgi:hypothetical protein